MKKMFGLLIMISIMFSTLTACGSDEESVSASKGENTKSSITTVLDSSAPSSETEKTLTEITAVSDSNVSTNDVTETDTAEEHKVSYADVKKDSQNTSEILWMSIYEIDLSGRDLEQEVYIIDKSGNCFCSSYRQGADDDSKKFDLYDDNWYDDLLEMTSLEKVGAISDGALSSLLQLSEDFEAYTSTYLTEYSSYITDSGINRVYGIYIDENNKSNYVLMCSFGERSLCTDNENALEFINKIGYLGGADRDYIFGSFFYETFSEENKLGYAAR